MQSTARLVGQTLSATIVTLIFAVSSSHLSVKICLYVAIGTALVACILSMSRAGRIQTDDSISKQ